MQKHERLSQEDGLQNIILICPKCKRKMVTWRDDEIALLIQCNCGYQEILDLKTGIVVNNDKTI